MTPSKEARRPPTRPPALTVGLRLCRRERQTNLLQNVTRHQAATLVEERRRGARAGGRRWDVPARPWLCSLRKHDGAAHASNALCRVHPRLLTCPRNLRKRPTTESTARAPKERRHHPRADGGARPSWAAGPRRQPARRLRGEGPPLRHRDPVPRSYRHLLKRGRAAGFALTGEDGRGEAHKAAPSETGAGATSGGWSRGRAETGRRKDRREKRFRAGRAGAGLGGPGAPAAPPAHSRLPSPTGHPLGAERQRPRPPLPEGRARRGRTWEGSAFLWIFL